MKAKKFISFILAVIMCIGILSPAMFISVSAADWNSPYKDGFGDDSKIWGDDWRAWKQTDARGKCDILADYGCMVVSMSRLLVESGAVPDDKTAFNPGIFLKWERKNGYINKGFGQTNKGGHGYAPVAYAKNVYGVKMSVTVKKNLTEKQLLDLLKTNYIIVEVMKGKHFAYVAREESLRDGKIYYRDSVSNKDSKETLKNLTTFNGSFKGTTKKPIGTYSVNRVCVYPVLKEEDKKTKAPETVEPPTIDTQIINVASGKNLAVYTGSYNASPKHNQDVIIWDFVKGDPSYTWTLENEIDAFIIHSATKNVALNAYANAPKSGTKVNIYNFARDKYVETQRWLIEHVGNEQYIIRLKYNENLVLTADGTKNGSKISVQTYDKSKDTQKWTFPNYSNEVEEAPLLEADEQIVDNIDPVEGAAVGLSVVTAKPSSQKVILNGKSVAFDAYLINGNNYFKLRDLAYALNGTKKQFEVSYNEATSGVNLISGKAYTPVGGEMTISSSRTSKTGNLTTSKIYLDNKEVKFTVYNIEGNNYFKLRDVMKTFDIYVGWDAKTSTITLDTSKGYVEP